MLNFIQILEVPSQLKLWCALVVAKMIIISRRYKSPDEVVVKLRLI